MNFLSHLTLAENQSELSRLGSVLPDFVGMGKGRVVRIKDPASRAALPDDLQNLQKGIDFHFLTDVIYDDLEEVSDLKRAFREEVFNNYFTNNRMLSLLLPTLGTDLLLDGYIIEQKPNVIEQLKKVTKLADRIDFADITTNPSGLEEVFEDFIPGIPDYRYVGNVSDSIANIARRRLSRPLTFGDKRVVYDSISQYQPLVIEAAPGILASMKSALDSTEDR